MLSDAFLTTNNLLNVLRQAALLFFMASGLTLVILTAGLDLSVGANVGLSACLAATRDQIHRIAVAWRRHRASAAARSIGLLNGFMVTALRMPSFIATYGMLWLILGATYLYMGGETVHGFPPAFRQFGSGYFLGIPIPIYLMLLFLLLGTLFAQRTDVGAADLRHRRQSGRRAAVRHSGRAAAGAGLCRERRDGGARLADLAGAR